MGLKLDASEESKLGFLSLGCTEACFKQSRTTPNSRHLLIKFKSVGPITLNNCLNNH